MPSEDVKKLTAACHSGKNCTDSVRVEVKDESSAVKASLELLVQAGVDRSVAESCVAVCSPEQLVQDVNDLRWIGQGSHP